MPPNVTTHKTEQILGLIRRLFPAGDTGAACFGSCSQYLQKCEVLTIIKICSFKYLNSCYMSAGKTHGAAGGLIQRGHSELFTKKLTT